MMREGDQVLAQIAASDATEAKRKADHNAAAITRLIDMVEKLITANRMQNESLTDMAKLVVALEARIERLESRQGFDPRLLSRN